MGYTTQHTDVLLGLGVSAISDTGNAFAQNKNALHEYYESIHAGKLAIQKGFILTERDIAFSKYILDISCKGETRFSEDDILILEDQVFPLLSLLESDGLVTWDRQGLKLTSIGRFFIRNVCSAFDLYLKRENSERQVFSKAI